MPISSLYSRRLNNGRYHGQKDGEVPTPAELISAEATDADLRTPFASVRKLNTRCNVDSEYEFVPVSSSDGAPPQAVPASLSPHFFHLSHYSLLAGHSGRRQMYEPKRKE